MRAMLDCLYDAMSAEVRRAGGTVENYAGDAVVAAFGAPAAHEDGAERVLHAALGMQRRLQQLFGGRLELLIGSEHRAASIRPHLRVLHGWAGRPGLDRRAGRPDLVAACSTWSPSVARRPWRAV